MTATTHKDNHKCIGDVEVFPTCGQMKDVAGLLLLSSASLTFSTSQTTSIVGGSAANGMITGTLTITGTPYATSGSPVTLSGPLTGNYSVIRN